MNKLILRVLLVILCIMCELKYEWPEGSGTEKARKKLISEMRDFIGGYEGE